MTKSYVRTATRTTLKVEANLTLILYFKANFHTEFEPFFRKKIYANNGGHFNPCSAAPGYTRIAETHPTAAPGCTRE